MHRTASGVATGLRQAKGFLVDTLAAKGTGLIVTVDNGISSVDEAEYIYRLGMQLVVTDHHQVGEQLPRAEAVVNPHRTDNQLPFTDFCGVGVAFKLACCLYDGEPAELLEQFGDLVAIGTMGDLVPLVGETRIELMFMTSSLH
jgi:single-stranded-DNA-specific exonuclease